MHPFHAKEYPDSEPCPPIIPHRFEEYAAGKREYARNTAATGIAPECPTPCRYTHFESKSTQERGIERMKEATSRMKPKPYDTRGT
jgi:hypothetical protein